MTETFFKLVLDWRIRPAARVNNNDWSKRARDYHASQKKIAGFVRASLKHAEYSALKVHEGRFRLGVAVFMPAVKSGPNKGGLPRNRGDWDNYYKAVLDALVYHRLLPGDTGSTVAGPCDVREGLQSGIYLGERDETWIVLEPAE